LGIKVKLRATLLNELCDLEKASVSGRSAGHSTPNPCCPAGERLLRFQPTFSATAALP
jgi:hypothetical protein